MGRHKVDDLHPDDAANLVRIRTQLQALAALNIELGVTKTDMANRVGRSHWFQSVLWNERTWPGYWKFSTFHDLCGSVGMLPTVSHPFGSTPMFELAAVNRKLLGAACQDVLEVVRQGSGVEVKQVAEAMGVAKSQVWRAENSEDPRLSTLMRYARVYGGWFKFGIEEK